MRVGGGNVNDLVLGTSTSSRTFKKVRTEVFDRVKKDFKAFIKDEFVSIQWNKKLIQEGRDFTAFEHIAVLSKPSLWGKNVGNYLSRTGNWQKSS